MRHVPALPLVGARPGPDTVVAGPAPCSLPGGGVRQNLPEAYWKSVHYGGPSDFSNGSERRL